MNDLQRISRFVKSLIRRKPGVEEGVRMIKKNLHKSFRFYDVRLVNLEVVLEGCRDFTDWLSRLAVSQPLPEGVAAVYFGLFRSEEGLQLYATGSKLWSANDPDWACRSDWRPEGGVMTPKVFREITKVYSEFNLAGYYIAVAYTVLMMLEFSRKTMVSLLDDKRRALHVACGFDDGELFNVGVMLERGIVSLRDAERHGMLPVGFFP